MASETYNEFNVNSEDDLELLPDGWGESDDFFNVDSWTGASAADAQKEGEDSQESGDDEMEDEQEGATTAGEDSVDSTETEEPTTPEVKGKLKFSATVDHKTEDVELDEAELPTIYQKAQATDRAQAKVAKMQPVFDQLVRTAKILGYDDPKEMLQAAEDSYRDGEVDRLVSEGTQKDVAEDYVRRKMKDADVPKEEPETPKEDAPTERDFHKEVQALLDLRPELKKPGTKLPDEVTKECVETGRPLAVVYLEYEARQKQAAYDALLKENKKLKQSAEAASRAPVRGVSRGGKTDTSADDDDFLKGFNMDD